MKAGLSSSSFSGERKHQTFIPRSLVVLDYLVLAIMLVIAAGVIWVLGGNRDWVMMPSVLLVFSASLLFVFRFLISHNRLEIAIPPGGWLSLLFLAYLFVQPLFARIPYEALLQAFKFSSYVAAYWIWFNLLRINGRWRWALALILVSVSMMACFAILQDMHGTRSAVFAERHADYGMRASGAYICPNHFAHLLVMIILASAGLLFSRRPGLALKLFAAYAVAVCLYPLLLSESRSGWIGLMSGLVVLAVVAAAGRGIKPLVLAMLLAPVVVAAAGWTVWTFSPRVQVRVADALAGNMRIALWQDSIEVARQAPWFGNGLGSYRHMYPHFRHHLKMTNDPEFAHNEFIHFWSELGVAGAGLGGLLVLVVFYRATRRAVSRDDDRSSAWLYASIAAVLVGSWTHAFFDFNFNIYGNVHVYVFLIAALFAAAGGSGREHKVPVAGAGARILGAMIVLVLIASGAAYARLGASYYRYIEGEARLDAHDWEGSSGKFKEAIAISAGNWRAHLAYADVMRTRAFWMRNPAIREEWIGTSRAHYEMAGRLNPWEGNVWYGLGMLYGLQGDQEAALAMKKKAATEIPRNTFYLNALGLQLLKMKRDREALEIFMQSQAAESTIIAEKNIQMLKRRLGLP